jgi:hypothetical protein
MRHCLLCPDIDDGCRILRTWYGAWWASSNRKIALRSADANTTNDGAAYLQIVTLVLIGGCRSVADMHFSYAATISRYRIFMRRQLALRSS